MFFIFDAPSYPSCFLWRGPNDQYICMQLCTVDIFYEIREDHRFRNDFLHMIQMDTRSQVDLCCLIHQGIEPFQGLASMPDVNCRIISYANDIWQSAIRYYERDRRVRIALDIFGRILDMGSPKAPQELVQLFPVPAQRSGAGKSVSSKLGMHL